MIITYLNSVWTFYLYLQFFSIKLPINNLAQMDYVHNELRKLNHIDLNVFEVLKIDHMENPLQIIFIIVVVLYVWSVVPKSHKKFMTINCIFSTIIISYS
jgi:hypothetical protein